MTAPDAIQTATFNQFFLLEVKALEDINTSISVILRQVGYFYSEVKMLFA